MIKGYKIYFSEHHKKDTFSVSSIMTKEMRNVSKNLKEAV